MTNYAQTQLGDRVQGCIVAGAIGDALGGPFEGQRGPLRFRENENWAISDDTQMTLATCEAIIKTGAVLPEQIAIRFVEWHRARRITGVGSSTLKALRDLEAGVHWALAGAKGEMAAGNGAVRIAPLAFHLDPKLVPDRQVLRDVCRITHHNERGVCRCTRLNNRDPITCLQTIIAAGDFSTWSYLKYRTHGCGIELSNLATPR